MNQTELVELFQWADSTLVAFTVEDCCESEHYYFNSVFVGGWAGDRQQFFFKQNDDLAKLVRMFDAFK